MNGSWTELLFWAGLAVAFIAIMWFSLRRMIGFWKTISANRQAGMYDDPEFKKRIKSLEIQRWSLVAAELFLLVAGTWALRFQVAPEIYWGVFLVLFLPTAVGLHVVDRRWRKLMTKGIA